MLNCLKVVQFIIRTIDCLNDWVGRSIAWLTLLMVVLTFIVVVLRYLFDLGWIPLQESVAYMHAIVFMLGAAYTLKLDGHVRVDIFYQRCQVSTQAWIDCLGILFLLLPVSFFIFWSSWDYVLESWSIQESSRNSGGLPGIYLLKTTLLLMSSLLILQGIALFLKKVIIALGVKTEED